MTTGPLEYTIIGFPGNDFTGDIVPALANLIDTETVRLLDLLFVAKDAEGDVLVLEFDELEAQAAYGGLDGEVGGILSPDDVAYVADALELNSSAALLIWEDLWATEFVDAVRAAGGVLIEGARIPHELAEAVFANLPAAV
ncbi:MAG: DUF6325 family protein [Acidimicrobiia bacterium]